MTTERIPRVSVGMPVYNGQTYLKAAIESVLGQTFNDFELVICDNASSDGTEEICRAYAAQDARVRYHRNPQNLGGSRNFSRVFELSRAPYFKWAAHDDICAPEFLEKSVALLDADPAVVLCYPHCGFIDQHGSVIGDHQAACNLRSPHPAARVYQFLSEAHTHCFPLFGLIRREALQGTSLVAPYISSDQILLLQLALKGEFYELPERLFYFREHPQRSVWQSKTFAGMASWYDPRKGTRIQLPRWRLAYEFLRSVARSGLPWREARKCYLSVLKWCRWHYRPLFYDLAMAAVQLFRRVFGLAPISDKTGQPPIKGATGFSRPLGSDGRSTASAAEAGKL